jgi:hypothetical protein
MFTSLFANRYISIFLQQYKCQCQGDILNNLFHAFLWQTWSQSYKIEKNKISKESQTMLQARFD